MSDANTLGSLAEQKSFEAEVGRLLHLMVHSVYTDRDIFLRELISNGSDACDKLRYEAVSTPGLLLAEDRLAITVHPDTASGTLSIIDNGIGMDREELIANLGTIARSGTRAFLERLGEKGESASLIGQFGVGFYAAFMVADEIVVVSRKAALADVPVDANVWTSNGIDGYTVRAATADEAAQVPRGTAITLKLKDDARTYLDAAVLERIVKTWSDHILFPVDLVTDGAEPRQINAARALWQRSKSEVTAEQYREAYQGLGGAFDRPRLTIHYRAEGRQDYSVLAFVPETKPFDLFDPMRKTHVKLYVNRVFISDQLGISKPNPKIYALALRDLELVPL
ncbi:MAG: molecular chaperone HtpG, partial [Sphingomonadales bacterium]|nr:molecular chaperone HtpG [Sphingomonadales bacterium]